MNVSARWYAFFLEDPSAFNSCYGRHERRQPVYSQLLLLTRTTDEDPSAGSQQDEFDRGSSSAAQFMCRLKNHRNDVYRNRCLQTPIGSAFQDIRYE